MLRKEMFMIRILGILLAAIFAVIALFHFYWAAGGKFGIGVAIPTIVAPNRGSVRAFQPSAAGTVLVGAAFLLAIAVIFGRLGLLGDFVPRWIFLFGLWVIALLFFLRAIGEFRLVGFFKTVVETPFAQWDTWLFSPLCLAIAVIAFVLAYSKA